MRLRAGAVEDAGPIAALFLAARREAMPYLPLLHGEEETRWWVENVVLVRDKVTLAVERESLLGFAARRGAHLEHLYVAPGAQGNGVGRRLLEAAKEASPGRLTLHVFQRNTPARAFYERNGFGLLRLRDGSDNEEQEPDAVYEWRRELVRKAG